MGRKPNVVYEQGLLSDADLRIMQVHTLLKDGIKPWEWDAENYPDNEMFGRFYQEDWLNIRAIDSMIADKERSAATTRATQEASRR